MLDCRIVPDHVRWLETMNTDARTKALKAKDFPKKLKEALKDA